jgi:hypothetical protein
MTAAAVLCKEQGITVVAVCIVYDVIVHSHFDPIPFITGESYYVEDSGDGDAADGAASGGVDSGEQQKKKKREKLLTKKSGSDADDDDHWVDPTYVRIRSVLFCSIASVIESFYYFV